MDYIVIPISETEGAWVQFPRSVALADREAWLATLDPATLDAAPRIALPGIAPAVPDPIPTED